MEGLLKPQMSYQRLETQRFSTPQRCAHLIFFTLKYQKLKVNFQFLPEKRHSTAMFGR